MPGLRHCSRPVPMHRDLAQARRFSLMHSNLDYLDMLHMPLFYHGAHYSNESRESRLQ